MLGKLQAFAALRLSSALWLLPEGLCSGSHGWSLLALAAGSRRVEQWWSREPPCSCMTAPVHLHSMSPNLLSPALVSIF